MNEYHEPTTFEEWVEIHGEPEYIFPVTEFRTRDDNYLDILFQDFSCEEEEVDTSGCVYKNKAGNLAINYGRFTDIFAQINKLTYCNGQFYTPTGAITAASIRKDIAYTLQNWGWTSKLDTPTNSLFQTIKDKFSTDSMPIDTSCIPLQNGDLYLKSPQWEFHQGEYKQTPYRLPVALTSEDAPAPLFHKWLNDLFTPEDQRTMQQMAGYLLIPSTRCQEAFFLVGEGGAGKSVLGVILEALFGNAYTSITTGDLVTKQFQLSQAENKLVLYDDDLGTAALTETSTLKKLITADQAIPAERKFADPYNFRNYSRIVACANFMLSALYDDSDGFWRRLHPIQILPKDKSRKTIRNFGQMIVQQESQQILRWALRGLKHLIDNDWNIYWSDRSLEYLGKVRTEGNYIAEFFQDCLDVNPQGDVTSAELWDVYQRWCKDNGTDSKSARKFQLDFKKITDGRVILVDTSGNDYVSNQVVMCPKVSRNGKYLRGYSGISIKNEWKLNFKIK